MPVQRLQLFRFEHVEGAAFRNRPGPATRFEDDPAAAQRSPVILYEDDKPLGPVHSPHDEVEYIGRGRLLALEGYRHPFS